MRRRQVYDTIYTHTAGGILCIVHAGIVYPGGLDIVGKRRFLEREYDWLRRALVFEPRGYQDTCGVFLTPPALPDTQGGLIWFYRAGFADGCGHGTIGVAMAMVSEGFAAQCGDKTTLRFETTGGVIETHVLGAGDEITGCRFENVPAFLVESDVSFELPGVGMLSADISFGGNYFAMIRWDPKRLPITPENGSRFREMGMEAKRVLNSGRTYEHPVHRHLAKHIDLVTFYHAEAEAEGCRRFRNVHVYGNGNVARSPGGTGVSALLAMLEGRGDLKDDEVIEVHGLLGQGSYLGRALGHTTVGSQRALRTQIEGRAHLLGYAKWVIDPKDPLREGYAVG